MIESNPSLKPVQLERVEQFGWPWHGLIRGTSASASGSLQVGDQSWNGVGGPAHTLAYLFDMGLPDQPASDEIAAQGGAWWGRALVRCNISGSSTFWGRGTQLRGLALWVRPEAGEDPAPPFFCWPQLVGEELTLQLTHSARDNFGGIEQRVTNIDITAEQLGQDAPAALVIGPDFNTMGPPHYYSSRVLDVRENRVLLGITGSAQVYTTNRPGGAYSNTGDGAASWHLQLLGLALVTITSQTEATWELLENRATALGNPAADEFDEHEGVETSGSYWRNYQLTQTYTQALAGAYFDDDGEVVTIRYDRTSISKMNYVKSGSDDQCVSEMTHSITLLSGSTIADEFTLSKKVEWTNSADGFVYAVTFTRDDDDPRRVEYVRDSRWGMNPVSPLSIGMPADGDQQMLVNVLGQTLTIGGVNVIPEQGYYQTWICRLDGRSVCICSAFEQSPYASGAPSVINMDAGPAVYPGGIDSRRITSVATAPAPGLRDYGFINSAAVRFTSGSYNPATGQLVRNDRTAYQTWV